MKIGIYDTHPAADIFPLLEAGTDIGHMRTSIQDRIAAGLTPLIDKIALLADLILDGRNRAIVLLEEGVPLDGLTYDLPEDTDPFDFVVAKNLARRHMSPSQLARMAVELEQYKLKEAAQRRMTAGTLADISESPSVGNASDLAGALVGVSGDLVEAARKVAEHGAPELDAALKAGAIAATTAAVIAELPVAEQVEAAAAAVAGDKPAVAKAKKMGQAAKKANNAKKAKAKKVVTVEGWGFDQTEPEGLDSGVFHIVGDRKPNYICRVAGVDCDMVLSKAVVRFYKTENEARKAYAATVVHRCLRDLQRLDTLRPGYDGLHNEAVPVAITFSGSPDWLTNSLPESVLGIKTPEPGGTKPEGVEPDDHGGGAEETDAAKAVEGLTENPSQPPSPAQAASPSEATGQEPPADADDDLEEEPHH